MVFFTIGLTARAINYIQSNDLLYRVALDTTSYDIPTLVTARNKDERRELLVTLFMTTGLGLAFAPAEVLVLNNIFSKNLQKNPAFFKLYWKHLTKDTLHEGIDHLNHIKKRQEESLISNRTIDKLLRPHIKKSINNIERAIDTLHNNPEYIEKVFKAKKKVIGIDLFLVALLAGTIAPAKNWVSRAFAGKTRFTGTQNYLSDEDLKKLTAEKTKTSKKQKLINGLLILIPSTLALTSVKIVQNNTFKGCLGKFFKIVRDYMDYDHGIYMKLAAVFTAVSVVKWANLVNLARDNYEKLETLVKFSLIIPSFYFGDMFFNGNIARYVDNRSRRKYGTPMGTFYNKEKSGKVFAHTKAVRDVIEEVGRTHPHLMKKAGQFASLIFFAGYIVHTSAVYTAIKLANRFTKKRVITDLQTVNQGNKILSTLNTEDDFTDFKAGLTKN